MNDFNDTLTLHKILGDPAQPVSRTSRKEESTLRARLAKRAKAEALAMVHGAGAAAAQTDATDAMLDQYVLQPNRRAVARRTVLLERWLADHGYRGGTPIRFARSPRSARYHDSVLALPTGRPVQRDGSRADHLVSHHVRSALHRTPPNPAKTSQISVVPGFVVVELSPAELAAELGIVPNELFAAHHVAVGSTPVGPGLTLVRDVSGDVLTHSLVRHLTHELAAFDTHQHVLHLPTPSEFAAHPERGWQLPFSHRNPKSLDGLAHRLVEQRASHLPDVCHAGHALTLSDLGFSSTDWINLSDRMVLDPLTCQVASAYLASLLLGAAVIEGLNEHPEALELATLWPMHAFTGVTCADAAHNHYQAANRYANFVRHAKTGRLSPTFLDGIYHRSVAPMIDFSHDYGTPHPVRLHTYRAPIHGRD